MARIDEEEYELLKELDDKWKWIARDKDGVLGVYDAKVVKTKFHNFWIMAIKKKIDSSLFSFIQWEDEEPHNIAELIKEYEIETGMRYDFGKIKVVDIDTSKLATRNGYIYVKESEETEVKKNIEWLKKEIGNMPYTRLKRVGMEDYVAINKSGVFELINQLDKREVLSQDWVKSHEQQVHPDHPSNAWWVASDDLQGLFVLKQGEVDQAYKDGYEKGKEHATKTIKPTIPRFVAEWIEFKKKSEIPYENVFQAIDELINSSTSKAHDWVLKTSENKDAFARAWLDGYTLEEEQKYYVVKSEGLDGVHYYFTKFNDEMNGLFTRPNDKKGAYRFDDKEKAQAIANYTDSKVEELE